MTPSKQKGLSLMSMLVASGLGIVLVAAGARQVMGQLNESQMARGLQMVAVSIPEALIRHFYVNNGTYEGLSDASEALLIGTYGIEPQMAWGGAWEIESQVPASPARPTSLVFRFNCAGLRSGCAAFIEALNAANTAGDLITAINAPDSDNVDVTYARPRS